MEVSEIDPLECISCETCMAECPNRAISNDPNGFCVVDPTICDNCKGKPACQLVCPVNCIKTVVK